HGRRHVAEDHAVRVEVKVFRTEKLDDAVIVLVVDENGAEKTSLRVHIAGESTFKTLSRHKKKATLYTGFLNPEDEYSCFSDPVSICGLSLVLTNKNAADYEIRGIGGTLT